MASIAVTKTFEHFTVRVVPVLKDNYSYVVKCLKTGKLAAVDVSEVDPIVHALSHEAGAKLSASDFVVLTTHRHADHSGGNKKLAATFEGLQVYGGAEDSIPAVTKPLNDGDSFSIGELAVSVRHTPCHTKGHVIYHVFHPEAADRGAVFTGDTMFVGGIGAFFEGTAEMMVEAMKVIGSLPPPTQVFPGHEYTMNFLKFAATVEPDNAVLKEWTAKFEHERKEHRPAICSTIEAERRGLNPFMRASFGEEALSDKTNIRDPVKLMQHLYDTCP
jgi:hydroxyacylglutathione hydrolase